MSSFGVSLICNVVVFCTVLTLSSRPAHFFHLRGGSRVFFNISFDVLLFVCGNVFLF